MGRVLDLGDHLADIERLRGDWTAGDNVGYLRRLCDALGAEVDWDDWSGERWAMITTADGALGYVSMALPLVILTERQPPVPADVAGRIVEIRVRDVEDHCLTADRSLLEDLFGDDLRTDVLGPVFSAQQLWFATI